DDSENRITVIGAIQLIGCSAEMLAVDLNLKRPLRVFARGMVPAGAAARRAGGKQFESREIAVDCRKVTELLLLKCRRHVGPVTLEQRRFGRDRDLLGNRPGLKSNIELRCNVDVDGHIFLNSCLETLLLDLYTVFAKDQLWPVEVAQIICRFREGYILG